MNLLTGSYCEGVTHEESKPEIGKDSAGQGVETGLVECWKYKIRSSEL
jgi:hypothetical protein